MLIERNTHTHIHTNTQAIYKLMLVSQKVTYEEISSSVNSV